MRAAVWDGPGEMHLGEVPDAVCPPDGALLRVTACGICGTDVRAFYNGDRRIEPGAVLGHEICGEVLEIGAVAEPVQFAVGDLVHVISTLYCGHCDLCRNGNEHLCQQGALMGFDFQGAYAELVAIPQIAMKNVFKIPDGLDDVHATFADPLSDAICGQKDLDIQLDDRVVVIGAGPVGTAHCALALAQGAGTVYLLETEPRRLELAQKVLGGGNGVVFTDVSNRDPVEFVRSETGDGAERVIVACSVARAQEQAMEMAAPRGRVLFFGGLPKGTTTIEFPSNVLHYREVAVLGSYASRYRDQVLALDMLRRNTHNVRGVISEVIPLEQTPQAFPRLKSGEALKVVVRP